ncbi:hypothetical protein HY990_01755 [Candidatus Micrarchaeota archaeon]|nr:hypothetical protein [Candidatus Micrarchaeota archaeon]
MDSEDTIEVCGGCGKLPRQSEHDYLGIFSCPRCGHNSKLILSSSIYHETVSGLEARFQEIQNRARLTSTISASADVLDLHNSKSARASSRSTKAASKKSATTSKSSSDQMSKTRTNLKLSKSKPPRNNKSKKSRKR